MGMHVVCMIKLHYVEQFSIHVKSLHDKIENKISLSNEVYKRMAKQHRQLKILWLVI